MNEIIGHINTSSKSKINNSKTIETQFSSINSLNSKISSTNISATEESHSLKINASISSLGIYITNITQNGNIITIYLSNGKSYSFTISSGGGASIKVNGEVQPIIDGYVNLIIPEADIAYSGNVKDLIQDEDTDLILDCGTAST